MLVDDAAFDAAYVRSTVLPLVTDPARLAALAASAAAAGSRDADEALADLVLRAAHGGGGADDR